jgi:hypothetical protein
MLDRNVHVVSTPVESSEYDGLVALTFSWYVPSSAGTVTVSR